MSNIFDAMDTTCKVLLGYNKNIHRTLKWILNHRNGVLAPEVFHGGNNLFIKITTMIQIKDCRSFIKYLVMCQTIILKYHHFHSGFRITFLYDKYALVGIQLYLKDFIKSEIEILAKLNWKINDDFN